MTHGFIRVAAAVPSVRVADCHYNAQQIIKQAREADEQGVDLLVFPELCLTGYTCSDLFAQELLLDEAEQALHDIQWESGMLSLTLVVGMPVRYNGALLNAAIAVQQGRILGLQAKTYLPAYKEFYEKRWFTSALDVPEGTVRLLDSDVPVHPRTLFRTRDYTFAIELCEDLWAPLPPSTVLALRGADILLNLSADNDLVGKRAYLAQLIASQSARCLAAYVYAGCGFGESTQDLVFGGKGFVYENGRCLAESTPHSLEPSLTLADVDVERLRTERRVNTTFASCAALYKDVSLSTVEIPPYIYGDIPPFDTLLRTLDAHPFVPAGPALDERCDEIFAIQTEGLAKRLHHVGAKTAVIGISGGLDSTLALLVCVRAFDRLALPRQGIIGVTMPGFGTTDRTHTNAVSLMTQLGVSQREIPIAKAVMQHFADISHDAAQHDITYENSQARERTQILMDVANQCGGLVIGTGDLSELALGWATYNGDHMSMYGVNASIPKTLVKHLVKWVATRLDDAQAKATLLDIVDTPISPELIPADSEGHITQKTEDLVGPYELHDFYLYHVLRHGFRPSKIFYLAQQAFAGAYDDDTLLHWLRTFFWRFFAQQFKRSCLPDGPKVGSCSLSPRGDWRMPSDASAQAWIAECKEMQEQNAKK